MQTYDSRNLLNSLPGAHILLDREFKIIEMSDDYLTASLTNRPDIVGRSIFEVFPDNSDESSLSGPARLKNSLERVLATGTRDNLSVIRYDIPNPNFPTGFEERWWLPTNSPVFGDNGEVRYILHSAVDVSDTSKLQRLQENNDLRLRESAQQTLLGGGEMGALMRAQDFSLTVLGPVESWPQSLRTAVSIMLENKFGMYIAWGPNFTQLYNDGYRPILGSTKHPQALGHRASETFAESWHIIGPMFNRVMAGETIGSEDWLLPLDRHGYLEECYFTFSYSPIRIESGEVGGILVTVNETTEQVRAKKAIEQTQSELTKILESIPQILWTARKDGSADFYNSRWYEYTGWNFEQSRDWGWEPLVHPDDFKGAMAGLKASVDAGTVWENEHRLLRASDQTWRWHLVRSIPLKDASGTVVKWIGTATDVHEQRLAQDEVVDVLESMNEGFFSVDKNFRVTRVNSRHVELTQISKEDQIGQYFFDLFPDAKNPESKYWIEYHRAMNDRVICNFEDYYAPLDLWTAVTVFPKVTGGFAAFFRDVTSDKRALAQIEAQAQQLKTLQERFEKSAKATDLGVWYCDLPFDVLIWNAEVKHHFFLPPDAHVTIDTFYERMHPDDREKTRKAIEQSIQDRSPYDTIFRTMPYLAAYASPVQSFNKDNVSYKSIRAVGWTDYNSRGEPIRFDGITLDVTATLKREEELRQAKETAEKANATKSAFLANMSHEIRTPLGAILGFSELLEDQGLSTKDRQHYIETINRSGKSLTRIIDDILDLAKVEAGRLEVEAIEFSLFDILSQVVDLFKENSRQKGIHLLLNIDESVPSHIRSDPTRMRQVLLNIIGNAVKFTDKGGVRIIVRAESLALDKLKICVDVKDTGRGLTQEQKERLFNPFMQADNTTTRQFGGTGLGLVLSKRLTEALGGTIEIRDSRIGEGSTFSITFLAEASDQLFKPTGLKKGALKLSNLALTDLRILVADDSPDNQLLVKRILEKNGAEVDVAGDGRHAVELALNRAYDIVLMDIQMPFLDGYQALAELKMRGYSVPVLALTAHAMTEEREKTRAAGFNGHLTKPIDSRELISLIESTIRGH